MSPYELNVVGRPKGSNDVCKNWYAFKCWFDDEFCQKWLKFLFIVFIIANFYLNAIFYNYNLRI